MVQHAFRREPSTRSCGELERFLDKKPTIPYTLLFSREAAVYDHEEYGAWECKCDGYRK